MEELWTWLAYLMVAFALLQSFVDVVFPPDLRLATAKLLRRAFRCFSAYCYLDITEVDGVNTNELYHAVQVYLGRCCASALESAGAASRLSLSRGLNSSAFTFGIACCDQLVDRFAGATVVWEHVVTTRPPQMAPSLSWRPLPEEKRSFTLRIRKKDRPLLLPAYLDHVLATAAELRRRSEDRLLYTNSRGGPMEPRGFPWECVPFKHPSTFDTPAMEPSRKEQIMADLKGFADGKALYEKTGRAWKRGYLLHGPPGTGMSSMIAAMANYLGYDVYDLELSEVATNSEFRKLLMKTTSKSIIVIEDIDCSVKLGNRSARNRVLPPQHSWGGDAYAAGAARKMTLSGLLSFTDGLWSCCGSERIFVFTTNHAGELDPALLRPGRMDMHITMSYCSYPAAKILMRNYLGLEDGESECSKLLGELEEEIEEAEVSEVLIKNWRREKRHAVAELLGIVRARVQKRKERGGSSATAASAAAEVDDEEEQEKRTLENETQVN